tara:strand:+ start:2042 stop:3142 length:1101 start_codon:yes stop_codon:yes gene_type:complete
MTDLNVVMTRNELPRRLIVELIAAIGREQTVLVQGSMGNAKTAIGETLLERPEFANHKLLVLDMATMDMGDWGVPYIVNGPISHTAFAPNEALGLHLDEPAIICMDELPKANRGVLNGGLRFAMARELFTVKLHKDSIVFATGNKESEGLNDVLLAHQGERFLKITMSNLTGEEVIEHGSQTGMRPSVMGFIGEYGKQLHQSYEDVSDYRDNPYINHPQAERAAFWSPRGATQCSQYVHMYEKGLIDKETLRVSIASKVGEPAMRLLMTYIELSKDVPSTEDIKQDPDGAKVPDNASAQYMLACNALSTIDKTWVNAWMTYMLRLHPQVQDMFVACTRPDTYKRREVLIGCPAYKTWCMNNHFLYS